VSRRSSANIAPWVKRQSAAVLVDLDALDGRPAPRDLRERLQAAERLVRLPASNTLALDQRAARLSAAAGLPWPPPTFANSPTNTTPTTRGGRS